MTRMGQCSEILQVRQRGCLRKEEFPWADPEGKS